MPTQPRRDLFAQIAAQEHNTDPQPKGNRGTELIRPAPPALPERSLPVGNLAPMLGV